MESTQLYDVIIVGGSYAGLAAAMALGRSLKEVLVIDGGLPCNRQTPHSHNFITHDGAKPADIALQARKQMEAYSTVKLITGIVTDGRQIDTLFEVNTSNGETFKSRKIILATGIKDVMLNIPGFAECWGISALHCPYCHGYEVRNQNTGIMANGDEAFEFTKLIYNWTKDLTLFTNGPSTLTAAQQQELAQRNISIIEKPVTALQHTAGQLNAITFNDGQQTPLAVLYARLPFEQSTNVPEKLGCTLTEDGYLQTTPFFETPVYGVLACGDNVTRMRSVANAVAMGTTAGAMANRQLAIEDF